MLKAKKILTVTIIIILISSLVAVLSLGSASGQPVVGSYDDPYERTVERGEKTTFSWTIEKSPDNPEYSVIIKTEGLEDLEIHIDPEDNFILDDNKKVSLSIEVPSFPDAETIKGSVIFSFGRNDEIEHTVERSITINVGGIPDTSESNTIVGGYRNPLPSPFDGPIGAFMINLLIWFAIAIGTFFAVTIFLHRLTKKTETNLDDIVVKMARRPLLIFIFLYGFIHSFLRLNLGLQIRATLYQFYSLLVLIIGGYVSYKIFDGLLDEISFRRGGEESPFEKVLKPIFEKIGIIIILLGGLIIGLKIIGVEITALLAGAGVFGLVVAFAAQDTLSNFFSGIHLLLDRPFTVGDVLELESGEFCRVENVGMRSTKLYDLRDHELIVLPNNSIANQKIKNLAEPDRNMRVAVEVGVAYGSDLEKVKDILYEVVKEHEDTITNEEFKPFVRFVEFGDSSLNFSVRFWVDDFMKQWDVTSDIRKRINKEFKEGEVTIPFPQRTVWMKSEGGEN